MSDKLNAQSQAQSEAQSEAQPLAQSGGQSAGQPGGPSGEQGGPSRLMPLALAGAAVLALAGAGMFYYATQTATGPERGDTHKVTVGRTTCDPADFTLPAGRQTFEIHNASDRPIEWEILDGVMVVEERENIAPGFHSLLTAKLKPGDYEITCGLLSNPRGRLVVTPSAASEAERNAPPITAFIGPLSEYKVYLVGQSSTLLREVTALAAAIDAGDLAGARAAWLAARLPYKRIEAVTGRIADLENAIDPLPDYLEGREKDPAFTGFHRIEYGLWSPDGTADAVTDAATDMAIGEGGIKALSPIAARLVSDVTALKTRLRAMKLAPEDLVGSAARQAERLSTGQISAGEDRWSSADLPGIEASLDGIAKAAGLLLPLVQDASPETAKSYGDRLAAATAALQALKQGADYPAFSTVNAQARSELAQSFAALATAASALNPAIGLE